MNDRADRLIKALGDIGEDMIEKAAPTYLDADSAAVPVNSANLVQYGSEVQITKKERIIYWVTHSLGVAAAAFFIIGAAVLLIMNWDKIAVREPAVIDAATTTFAASENDDTATLYVPDIIPEELLALTMPSKTVDGKCLRLVCNEAQLTEGRSPVCNTRDARVEIADTATGQAIASAQLLTRDDTFEWERGIELKLAKNRRNGYWGLVFMPLDSGEYMMTPYVFTADGKFDFDPYNIRTVKSPDDVTFRGTDDSAVGIEIRGKGNFGLNDTVVTYDDNTPYDRLYRGVPAENIRVDCDIEGTDLYASVRLNEITVGEDYSRVVRSAENATVTIHPKNGDGELNFGEEMLVTKGYEKNNWVLKFDTMGSFNVIAHTLDAENFGSKMAVILVGVPLDKRFTVTVYAYDGRQLERIRDLFIETEQPLESIVSDGKGVLTYHDIYTGDKSIVLDLEHFTYTDRLNGEAEEAAEQLRKFAESGNGFAYPIDVGGGLYTLRYKGNNTFTVKPDMNHSDVYAITDGTVSEIGCANGCGNYMIVKETNGTGTWVYSGLYYDCYVAEGMSVVAGEAIADAVDEITIMYNKPIEHIPYENPMILPDESAVEVTEGEVSPPESLSEFSADSLLTQQYLEWAKLWSDTHDNNYERYKVGEFLDSLGVDGLKELYFKGYFLNSITVTDDLPTANGGVGNARITVPVADRTYKYFPTGYTYESFRKAWLEVFTEEWANTLLNQHAEVYCKYGDELYCQPTAAGGDLTLVHIDYLLQTQTDDEIVFLSKCYHVKLGEDPVYDEMQNDKYTVSYNKYRIVRTNDGWRIAFSDTFYHWR